MTEMPDCLWVYRARVTRVVDGDTADAVLDMGLHIVRTERLRLLGIDTPERRGATKAAGDAALVFVVDWLAVGTALDDWPLIIETHKSDAFGRFLAVLWRAHNGACLNADIVTAGHAIPYIRGTHRDG